MSTRTIRYTVNNYVHIVQNYQHLPTLNRFKATLSLSTRFKEIAPFLTPLVSQMYPVGQLVLMPLTQVAPVGQVRHAMLTVATGLGSA